MVSPGAVPRGRRGPLSVIDGGAPALPPHLNPRTPPQRRRGKLRYGRIASLVAVLALVVVGIGAVLVGARIGHLNSLIHRITVHGLAAGASGGSENILLVGSTSRCALKVQSTAYGLCSQGVTGVNSDVVMIVHLDGATQRVSLLSIPRDTFTPNARAEGAYKIDAALAEGPSQLVAAIEEDYGVPIQHYVELNFDTFASVVDALGGVRMYFPEEVYDAESGLNVQNVGCRTLTGFQALQVVRARHLQYKGPGVTSNYPPDWPQENQSDLARIRRDHEFLKVLARAVSKRGLSNPLTDLSLAGAVAPDLQVDSGLSASAIGHLILAFHSVNIGAAPTLTVPVSVDNAGGYIYQGYNYGDVVLPVEPADRHTVQEFLGVSAGTNTLTGAPLPAASAVKVAVVNGTGVANQASDTAASLRALGYTITGVSGATPTGPVSETVVYYAARTPADQAAAQRVLQAFSGTVIMAMDPTKVVAGSTVTVVTGTNFSVASPPSATPAASSPAASASSAPASASPSASALPNNAQGVLSTPSATNEALQPWDPRSCTPSGGEGP